MEDRYIIEERVSANGPWIMVTALSDIDVARELRIESYRVHQPTNAAYQCRIVDTVCADAEVV